MKSRNFAILNIKILSNLSKNFYKFEKTRRAWKSVDRSAKFDEENSFVYFRLKNELVKNNQMMQAAGLSLAKQTEALIREYHRQSNIQQTIDVLSQAFPGSTNKNRKTAKFHSIRFILVFDTYRKLQECMEEKRFDQKNSNENSFDWRFLSFRSRLYPALKLLEQLETKHLVLVKEHRWSEIIQHNIAKFRDQIRNESHNELKNFLENVATHADKIGKSAFAQVRQVLFFSSILC